MKEMIKNLSKILVLTMAFCFIFNLTACVKKVPVTYEYGGREEFIAEMEARENPEITVYYELKIEPYDVHADYTDLELDMSHPDVYSEKVAYYTYYVTQFFESMGIEADSEDYEFSTISVANAAYVDFVSLESYLKYEKQFVDDMRTDPMLVQIEVFMLRRPAPTNI